MRQMACALSYLDDRLEAIFDKRSAIDNAWSFEIARGSLRGGYVLDDNSVK